jgi:hypothetical protein
MDKKLIQLDMVRVAEDPTYGTYGILKKGNVPFCCTLELPWRNNQKKVSRIPAGIYVVTRYQRANGQWVFLVNDVPGRDMIELHVANLSAELEGCITVGNSYDEVVNRKGQKGPGVSASVTAFAEVVAATMNQPKWLLNIVDRITK